MGKCKNTIINEMVDNTAEIIKAKIEYLEIVDDLLGNDVAIRTQIIEMKSAVSILQKYSGCWV